MDNTRSLEVWKQVENWIDVCANEHPYCPKKGRVMAKEKFPDRLLDLKPLDSEKANLCLIISKDDVVKGDYATLSHC
jgi:hypothetical protein